MMISAPYQGLSRSSRPARCGCDQERSEKDNEIDLDYDPLFEDDMKGSLMEFGEIGPSNHQSACSIYNQNHVVSVVVVVSLR
jgi:hypothetical protein